MVVARVIEERCLDCHDGEEKKGGVDLSLLIRGGKVLGGSGFEELWGRVERVVKRGEMPPKEKKGLVEKEKLAVKGWYRGEYVLRGGEEVVEGTRMRRLTRVELENSLEEVLGVNLRVAYVRSAEMRGMLRSTIEQMYPEELAGESGFRNDAEQLYRVKVPVLKFLKSVDFGLRMFEQSEEARVKVWGNGGKMAGLEEKRAEEILRRFSERAWRGCGNEEAFLEVMKWYGKVAKGGEVERGLLGGMRMILMSPCFVYRLEGGSGGGKAVSGGELAVRLGYFLWSSGPDEELMRLGKSGKLLEPLILRGQIERMLNSPKRLALAENFAGQWLGFEELWGEGVHYRGEQWTRGVYDELLYTFDEVIKSDRNILELVDADWAYLNRDKAKELGVVEGEKLGERYADVLGGRRGGVGKTMERLYDPPKLYRVTSDRVGGMVTTDGTMSLTSAPERTNPIRRGVWVLENILGRHLEVPVGVPPLEVKVKVGEGKMSTAIGDLLKVHTAKAECRVCHRQIDPLGLGLENFSPTGEWRVGYPKEVGEGKKAVVGKRVKLDQSGDVVVALGVLPNGQAFRTPKEMKKGLLEGYGEEILENMIQRMFAYALGRKVTAHDGEALEKIKAEMGKKGNRMSVLIEEVIFSRQFLEHWEIP